MRSWLLTNTTYGTWLPGDERGSVTSVRGLRPEDRLTILRIEHDLPGTPYEDPIPNLKRLSELQMKGPPVWLNVEKAEVILTQVQETCAFRKWLLRSVAIMSNHWHVVIQVPDDPKPRKVLADLKAWMSRRLNDQFGEPESGTWWTGKGSKRKLSDEKALENAIQYVLYK
jgi:REP element-mobilizing transposase RayT